MRYTVLLLPEPTTGGYSVYVPAIPGCVTQSQTIEEGLARATSLARDLLDLMAERDEELPIEAPGAVVGSFAVEVPALVPSP